MVPKRLHHNVDHKYLGSFEMCWRRMEKISWTNRVRNVEGEEKYPTHNKKKKG
jgi:hypothetical protein